MKTWLVTPSFCKAKMLEQCLEHIYATPPKDFQHIIVDNHYPIDKQRNRARIKELADQYGCTYVDSGRDLGLHKGINNAMAIVGVQAGDIWIGCDPDDRPSPGFVDAMRDVMIADPKFAVLGCWFWVVPWKKSLGIQFEQEEIAGHKVWIHPSVEMFNVAAFNTTLVLALGGFNQPHEYYGGIEAELFGQWVKLGMKFGYLTEITAEAKFVDRADLSILDPEYRTWKDAHVAGFAGSFEEWLKVNKPELL